MPLLEALYFDGHSARAQAVRLALQDGSLQAFCPRGELLWTRPAAQLQWPERTRHGQRVIHLADGATLQVADGAAFDRWRAATPGATRDSWVVRVQQNWPATLAAVLVLLLLLAAGYRWGLPWAADAAVAVVPASVDAEVGASGLQALRQYGLQATALLPSRQQALRERFAQVLRHEGDAAVPWQLHFMAGGKAVGPNALALPGGHIVLTDEMVALLDGREDTLLGVLCHEYGHVRLRHGMRALARFTLLTAATSVALGDFSSLLAAAPALLGHLGYARDAEREADAESLRLMRQAGLDPAAMVVLFERMQARTGGGAAGMPIALASHPHDEERVRLFREAGR